MKKRILVVAGGYFPATTYGGPPVSIRNFCNLMKDDFDFYIIAVDHELHQPTLKLQGIHSGWNSREEGKVIYLSQDEINKEKFENIINEIQPNLVYANSFFDYKFLKPFIQLTKDRNIPLFIAPRGQLLEGAMGNKKTKKIIYSKVMKALLNRHPKVTWQSTSAEETEAIKHFFPKNNVIEIDNIPTVPQKELSGKVKKEGLLQLIFLSRIVPKKNLKYVLEILNEIEFPVVLDIYGPIEDKIYWEECQKLMNTLPDHISVFYKGTVNPEDVSDTFSKYDAFFFPTYSENFGHVIAESLSAGCPVIVSDNTPWLDLEENNAGYVIPLKQDEKYKNALKNVYSTSFEEKITYSEATKEYIVNRFNLSKMNSDIKNNFFYDINI